MHMVFAAVIGCLVAGTAMAQEAAAPASDAKPEKKICRRELVTGSILGGKRLCHTKAEWAEIDARATANAEEFGRKTREGGNNFNQ